MSKRVLIIGIIVLAIGAFLVWLFTASSKPLPGQKMDDLGRKHVASVQNSQGDLATSGDHYGDWTKAGIYEQPQDDGNLIHSLEHGYVILSFKCQANSEQSTEATESATIAQCDELKSQLNKIYEKKGKRKIIIVSRPQMSTRVTLYAWNYLLTLDAFDEARISEFIDTHRDQGPERTAE